MKVLIQRWEDGKWDWTVDLAGLEIYSIPTYSSPCSAKRGFKRWAVKASGELNGITVLEMDNGIVRADDSEIEFEVIR